MSKLIIMQNELTAEQFRELWATVWGDPPDIKAVELALKNSLFRVSVFDGEKIVAMARMLGDMGLCCYIKDVIVRPGYQGRGIGRLLINELLDFTREHGIKGTDVFVELAAVPDKIPFYEKLGFDENEAHRLKMMLPVTGGGQS